MKCPHGFEVNENPDTLDPIYCANCLVQVLLDGSLGIDLGFFCESEKRKLRNKEKAARKKLKLKQQRGNK